MPLRLLQHPLGGGHSAADVFAAVCGDSTDVFWLDSGADGTSYIGSGTAWYPPHPVLDAVRAELAAPAPLAEASAPPFRLGLVGWFGYELRGETMGVPVTRVSRYPDAAFLRVTRAVAVESDGTAQLLALGESWEEHAEWRESTVRWLRSAGAADASRNPEPARGDFETRRSASLLNQRSVTWHETDAQYLANIAACQEAIHDGEAYQLCLTTEASVEGCFDPVQLYSRVRALSPSHHGALLRIGGVSLLSASPERFLEVHPDGIVRTHPIKGTRPRDPDAASDARLRDELLASDKERAENIMIVDLMRNDLARVSEPGSVTVPSLLDVESYAQVHQLVSSIEGRLRDGLDAVDAIAACLPAGSMTGAPKQRATEILDGLEGRARGLYAGAFGYAGRDGRVDLAMTIRSIVLDERGATVGAGGGITALSVPEEELAEARLKAAALLGALGVATLE